MSIHIRANVKRNVLTGFPVKPISENTLDRILDWQGPRVWDDDPDYDSSDLVKSDDPEAFSKVALLFGLPEDLVQHVDYFHFV